nr:microsomal glutathione S-transferase 1-like [Lytechinus pictus]
MSAGFDQSAELTLFATYATIVLLKMILMAPMTAYHRITKNVFANPEDATGHSQKDKKVIFNDPDVERVRRCHLNDLENIVPFFGLGLLYALVSGASLTVITWHYRVFVISRILHTVAYVGALPQPSRGLCFLTGLLVNVSMAVQILRNAAQF